MTEEEIIKENLLKFFEKISPGTVESIVDIRTYSMVEVEMKFKRGGYKTLSLSQKDYDETVDCSTVEAVKTFFRVK